ncbi:MAG TPA: hypothetical protein VK154_20070 [Chitinophagales bacterium]|nr:hypothetical protein [Chitinophagales bacterium]
MISVHEEIELLLELGNRLVRLYCSDCVPDITCLTKWTFRDALIRNIAFKWNIPYDQLPGEQTLYRAFRDHKYSSATKEKLALFYYAITDPTVALIINKEYEPLAGIQRTQTFPYWNRFVKEVKSSADKARVAEEEIDRLKQFVSSLDENKRQILLNLLQAERSKSNISVSINREIEVFEEKKAVA